MTAYIQFLKTHLKGKYKYGELDPVCCRSCVVLEIEYFLNIKPPCISDNKF